MPKSQIRTLWTFLLLLALAASATAQTTGTIRGQARDQEGRALPGVTVTATSDSRGTSRATVSGDNGHFILSSLSVGTYSVTSILDGFHEQVVEGLYVGISATVTLDVRMPLASVVDEVITITSSPALDVSSSSVASSFTSEFIEDLPTDRNFYDMMAVAPGVSAESEGSTGMSVFGSGVASNSWSIDGLDTTNTDTGSAWWYINPAIIAEVQVMAVGAPAQYGNMSGGAFNVVTKSGTNDLEGSIDLYYQDDSLTGENAELDGIPFHRDEFLDFSFSLGGPLKRDKLWFFLAYEDIKDASSDAGVDPDFPDTFPYLRYDLKLNASLSDNNLLEAKAHYDEYDWAFGEISRTPDAQGAEFGEVPAWGIRLQSVLGADNFLELHYAGYNGTDNWQSRTGSTADPFLDYSPDGADGKPDNSLPTERSGSLYFPYVWELAHEQVDATLSHYADDFLGEHDFKFGVSYVKGEGDTVTAGGLNGVYFYRYQYPDYTYEYYGNTYTYEYPMYYYRVTARPYHYGADAEALSAFIDDQWQVTHKLTLNVGLRFDQHNADIPDFPRLNQDWSETGDTIPGLKDAVDWTLWSPRIGFAYKIGDRGVLRGFYGKFYDGNVTGNWYSPPPDAPSYLYEYSLSPDGPWTESYVLEQLGTTVDPDLKAPETDQFTFGYEHQIGKSFTLGIQGIYKESKNLIGWEILGDGLYEFLDWENPFTGETITLASIVEQPSTRKGNGPGAGSLAAPGTKFNQEYEGAFISVRKRHTDGWSLQGSYTWSNSTGFLPRPLSQGQGSPFFTGGEGRDPNNWINAEQALQNEREHVLQMQANFDLPWKLNATVIYSYLDGKPYNRQFRAGTGSSSTRLEQGAQGVIVIPASSDARLPAQNVLDLALGRRFELSTLR